LARAAATLSHTPEMLSSLVSATLSGTEMIEAYGRLSRIISKVTNSALEWPLLLRLRLPLNNLYEQLSIFKSQFEKQQEWLQQEGKLGKFKSPERVSETV